MKCFYPVVFTTRKLCAAFSPIYWRVFLHRMYTAFCSDGRLFGSNCYCDRFLTDARRYRWVLLKCKVWKCTNRLFYNIYLKNQFFEVFISFFITFLGFFMLERIGFEISKSIKVMLKKKTFSIITISASINLDFSTKYLPFTSTKFSKPIISKKSNNKLVNLGGKNKNFFYHKS